MARHNIDYGLLLKHIEQMINLLEYDSMRSAGKAKVNSHSISDLYLLSDRYSEMLTKVVAPEVSVKKTSKSTEE